MNQTKYVIARHFINERESLDEFSEQMKRILSGETQELLRMFDLKFGLKLTVDESKTKDLEEEILEERRKLPLGIWLLYDPIDRGPGTSFGQIIFNPTFSGSSHLITSADLDQFPLEEDPIGILNDHIERVGKEGSIYGPGSRDIPIRLGKYDRNSDLRKIHELFFSLTIGSEKLIVKEPRIDVKNVTLSYAEIGESTTGFYTFNTEHPEFIKLMNEVSKFANFRSFSREYYAAIRASQLGKVSTGYVNFRENKFYGSISEEDELNSVERLIEQSSRELGRTNVRKVLHETLKLETNVDRIAKFYPRKDVEYVRSLMIRGLLSKN